MKRAARIAVAFMSGLAVIAAAANLRAAATLFIVQGGKAMAVRDAAGWASAATGLRSSAGARAVLSAKDLGPGDFRIAARLKLDQVAATAASFTLNDSHLGFDGRGARNLFLEGSLFAGHAFSPGAADLAMKPEAWFDLEVARTGAVTRFLIDGREIVRLDGWTAAVRSIGFRPHRNRMTIERFELSGHLVEPPDFLACADYDWNWSNDVFRSPDFHEKAVDLFLGKPAFEQTQIFQGSRLPNIVVALDGTVIAGWGVDRVRIRRSEDGGKSWQDETELSKGIIGGGFTVDEISGDLLAFVEEKHPPARAHLFRSKDHGKTWAEQPFTLHPNSLGHVLALSMNEHGITIRRGQFKGRLIRPARWYGRMIYQKDFGTHYTSAIFSDDGGNTWKSAEPFPEWGTGEACIAELSDGTLYYNTRRHWAPRGEDALWRYSAESRDGGATWQNAQRSKVLPDGNQNTTYGLMGGLVRLPVLGRDILLFSNIVHPSSRQNGHVWASFDGGLTWPIRRQVFEGAFAYSALNAGRPGTPSAGWIYLLYEGGPEGGGTLARFNLAWVLGGEKTGDGELPDWAKGASGP